MITVPSIMHSGTRLLRNVILKDIEVNGFHTYEMDKFTGEGLVISPLRHPRRIAKSFKDRERKGVKWPYSKENLDYQWDCMLEIDKYNPFYVHIDHEIRDLEIDLISDKIGVKLEKNWTVSKESGAQLSNHDIDLDQCPEVPQYQVDFYFKTIERMKNG
jgi:hypothetical protein